MGGQQKVEDSSVKILGRVLILSVFCAATCLVFSDLISYWTGWGGSRIERIDVGKLTFIRDDRIRFGGPGVHFKEVKYFRTQEGDEVVMFQSDRGLRSQVFIRGRHKIYGDEAFEEVTTYEPFVAWTYLLKRSAVLFILLLMILAVAGFVVKMLGKGQLVPPVVRKRQP
jgi:hypothetical protein